jgi:hypothetical protein
MTAPSNFEQTASTAGSKSTGGQRTRLIPVPVPPISEGGIFDLLDAGGTIEQANALIRQLELGTANHYGHLFPRWVKYLMNNDCEDELSKMTDVYARRLAPNGWEYRFAKKFAVFAPPGDIAIRAGLLPWPTDLPWQIVSICYQRAVSVFRQEEVRVQEIMALIRDSAENPARFIRRTKLPKSHAVAFNPPLLGIRVKHKGAKVLAIRDESLKELVGSQSAMHSLTKTLAREGVLVGGSGHVATTQLSIPLKTPGGTLVERPRFWLVDYERLRDLVARG